MNDREKIITKEIVAILKKHLKPSQIILFGSRAKGNNGKAADFDFAVNRKKPQIHVHRKIMEEIDKISGLYKVDIVYLPSVDKAFKNIIFNTGKVIYERRA